MRRLMRMRIQLFVEAANDTERQDQGAMRAQGTSLQALQFPEPWDVKDGETCPYPASSAGAEWWPRLMAIRAQLIKEIGT